MNNFYDFTFKWTATAVSGIHPTKARLSQLVNFKNTIWHFRRTICNKNSVLNLEKMMPQKRMECFWLLLEHLAWIEHQFLSGIRDSRKAGSLWGMMRGVGGVRKSIHQSWLAKQLRLLYWGFKEVQEEIPWEEASTLQIGVSSISTRTMHQSTTPSLSQTGIKTVSHPPYSPDIAPCDFWLFPKLRGCRYETIEMIKEAVTKVIDTFTQEDFHEALLEVVGTVQQVHCIWRRLLWRGLEFHVCTTNKSAHPKKVWKLIVCTSYDSKWLDKKFCYRLKILKEIWWCIFIYQKKSFRGTLSHKILPFSSVFTVFPCRKIVNKRSFLDIAHLKKDKICHSIVVKKPKRMQPTLRTLAPNPRFLSEK